MFCGANNSLQDFWKQLVKTEYQIVRFGRHVAHFFLHGFLIIFEIVKGNSINLADLIYLEEQTVFFNEIPDEVSYAVGLELGSHNSYANLQDGWLFFDQVWNIPTQLEKGVRHLLLDFHYHNHDTKQGDLVLCHGNCSISKFLKPGTEFMAATKIFQQIKNFLDHNPKAIISIDVENFTNVDAVVNAMKSAGILSYLLTPQMINGRTKPLQTNNPDHIFWPTYGQLRLWNKRLILFDDTENRGAGTAEYAFSIKKTLLRNTFGTLDTDKASEPRDETDRESIGDTSRLLQLNYFLTMSPRLVTYFTTENNTRANIMDVYGKLIQKRIISELRPIKYIVLEYVGQNNNEIMSMINSINNEHIKNYSHDL